MMTWQWEKPHHQCLTERRSMGLKLVDGSELHGGVVQEEAVRLFFLYTP